MPIEDLTTYTHALLRAKRVPRKVHPPSRTNCHKGQSSVCQIALSPLCLSLLFLLFLAPLKKADIQGDRSRSPKEDKNDLR